VRLPGARRDFVEQLQKVGQEAMRKDVRDSDKPAKTLIPTSPKAIPTYDPAGACERQSNCRVET